MTTYTTSVIVEFTSTERVSRGVNVLFGSTMSFIFASKVSIEFIVLFLSKFCRPFLFWCVHLVVEDVSVSITGPKIFMIFP